MDRGRGLRSGRCVLLGHRRPRLWLAPVCGCVVAGGGTALAGDVTIGVVATTAALAAGVAARRNQLAAALFAIAGIGHLAVAVGEAGLVQAVTGTALLGGMTSKMLLGHWFFVDPQPPRRALRRLDVAAEVGLVSYVAVVAVLGVFA